MQERCPPWSGVRNPLGDRPERSYFACLCNLSTALEYVSRSTTLLDNLRLDVDLDEVVN